MARVRRGMKRVLLYGVLLAAGAALGMQLMSADPEAGGYAAQAQMPAVSPAAGNNSPAALTAGQGNVPPQAAAQGNGGAAAAGYEQGTYVKLPNGTTYYYVQSQGQAASGTQAVPSALPQIPAGSGSAGAGSGASGNAAALYQSPGQLLLSPAPQTSVDRFADKTGELLQNASRKGIDWVVSLFTSLTD
jgi:hypothetical protein